MRITIFALALAFVLSASSFNTAQAEDAWKVWTTVTQKNADAKEASVPTLTHQRDSACPDRDEGKTKACLDLYNGIIKQRMNEKNCLEGLVKKTKNLPAAERDRVIPVENAECNRIDSITTAIYRLVVQVYPPKATTTGMLQK